MAASFVLKRNDKGQFSFNLKAGNNEIILRSEQYQTEASARNGIASVQKNCGADANYEKKESADGQFFFNLKAANHEIIGSSELYKTAASRDGGIDAVKRNGATTTIETAE
jgi:uncharacterized protein